VEIKKKKQLLMSQIFDHALMSFSSVSEHISQGSLYTTTKYKTKKIIFDLKKSTREYIINLKKTKEKEY